MFDLSLSPVQQRYRSERVGDGKIAKKKSHARRRLSATSARVRIYILTHRRQLRACYNRTIEWNTKPTRVGRD